MVWINTREELPEEGRLVLVKFERHDPDSVSYWACKRDGDIFSIPGCGCFVISRECETYWVYISEIEGVIKERENGLKQHINND